MRRTKWCVRSPQFGNLCSLLGVSGSKMGSVLEALLNYSVLVQGCWVVASHVIYPDSNEMARRNIRDYMVRECGCKTVMG